MAVILLSGGSLLGAEEPLLLQNALAFAMRDSICPSCGNNMKSGFLIAESLVGGAKWVHKRTKLSIGGEKIMPTDAFGNVYIAGFRCTGCRYLSFRY